MKKLLILAGLVLVIWLIWRSVLRKPIVDLKGWSPFNTQARPVAGIEDRSSGTMGMRYY